MNKKILTELMGVRFDSSTYQLIKKTATAQGIGACDFVRWSVKRELAKLGIINDTEVLRALGIDKKGLKE